MPDKSKPTTPTATHAGESVEVGKHNADGTVYVTYTTGQTVRVPAEDVKIEAR